MEVSILIRIALWVPFAFILLISGLIFAIRGWKKGLPRTVLYLVATVLAAIVGLLLARLISKFASPPLVDLIMQEASVPEGMGSGLVISLIEGLCRAVVSMLLFPFLLFLFNILIRLIVTHIRIPFLDDPRYKLPGVALAIGLITAFLYSILMMLPVYGTIGAYVPTIRSVMELSGEEMDEETTRVFRELEDHTMVKVAYSGVAASFYDELTALPLRKANLLFRFPARPIQTQLVQLWSQRPTVPSANPPVPTLCKSARSPLLATENFLPPPKRPYLCCHPAPEPASLPVPEPQAAEPDRSKSRIHTVPDDPPNRFRH